MGRFAPLVCASAVIMLQVVDAQVARQPRRQAPSAAARAALPVRRVVLYKNGVGYFEHLGTVRDAGRVNIDFNSGQLDDALKSLTALDLGNGRVTGISCNSEAPVQQRLAALRLPVGERATLPDLLTAMRGARLEVRSGDRVVTGRLLGVERRTIANGTAQTWRDELSLVSDAGEIRTVELTPSVTVRLAERDSADQVGSYLGLLASNRAPDRRRMTIDTAGTGERTLLVSYVSEVPIWKTSYRIVLSPDGETPILQGWAIVDNTTAEDWTNVDLSLVAGAPQSFIQQISQPRYARRPVVQPAQAVLLTPQTHDPTLTVGVGRLHGAVRDTASGVLPGVTVRILDAQRRTVATSGTDRGGNYAINSLLPGTYRVEFMLNGFNPEFAEVTIAEDSDATQNATLRIGAPREAITVTGESPSRGGGFGVGIGGGTGGGSYRAGNPPNAVAEAVQAPPPPLPPGADMVARLQNVQAAASPRELTDLFEYRLTSPISIPRNQSALVPILNARATVERVSVWNGGMGAQPLRALWLTNTTGLTLDGGSFTVLDEGAFAGEGLVEPLKPEEKRLLSYAVDLGVQVESRLGDERKFVTRLTAQHGVLIEHREQRARRVYTIRNNDTTPRTILIEHPTRGGWSLANGVKPVETSVRAYRFSVAGPAKKTTTFTVEETQPIETRYEVAKLTDDQVKVLVRDVGDRPELEAALGPILAAKRSIAELTASLADRHAQLEQLGADQARIRENLHALSDTKGDKKLLKRYTAQLSEAEDRMEALRKERTEIDRDFQRRNAELATMIEELALSIDVRHPE